MEAVCPECQVRYEVSEELLAQGTSIGCPTCGVSLDLIQPDEQANAQPDGVQEQSNPTSAEAMPQTDKPAEETTSDTLEAQAPQPGWDADQLLWGNEEASSEQTVAAPDQETEAWGSVPTWGDPVQDTEPEGQIQDQDTPQTQPTDDHTETPATQAEESVDGQTEIQDRQPPEPEDSQTETTQAQADDPVKQLAQTAQTESTQAKPGAPATTEPEQPADFVQPQVASLSQSLTDDKTEPGSQDGEEQTDWAAAAAKWAESGFSTDNMPDFVKGREAEANQDTAQPSPTPVEPLSNVVAQPTPQTILPPEEPKPEEEVNHRPRGRAITPPPLPSVGNANLPSPATKPPPLERRQASYNLQGTGEGQQEPWHQEEQPQQEQPADSGEPIPLSPPEQTDQEIQAAAFAPKTSTMTKVLVMLGTVGVIVFGVWLALHFSEGKLFQFGKKPAADKKDNISSGPTSNSASQPKPELATSKKKIDKPATEKTKNVAKPTKPAKTANNRRHKQKNQILQSSEERWQTT